jgi:hypothetical protein
MKNQIVSTKLGVIVLVIIAITVGALSWKIVKDREASEITRQGKVAIKKPVKKQSEVLQQQPSQDKTINWKTYSNNKYGFSLKYPEVLKYGENEISKSVQQSAVKGEGYFGPEVFSFSLAKGDPNNTDSGIVITIIKRENKNSISQLGSEEGSREVAGQVVKKYSGSYYAEKNGFIYQISSFGDGDTYYSGVLSDILTTFQFTK